ncbi:hypothetical protein [Micromonospora thermarum]|uniref:Uncharacterized protein n=1 Tax=Micromonospora thermarum TaxID=2720024 RepID=A0ABX0ZD47_9ACTN|nr:hypothetical protein [Micromonospora thermarum]NJP35847.1 hypothetical protein [Micromonospora thermarum]
MTRRRGALVGAVTAGVVVGVAVSTDYADAWAAWFAGSATGRTLWSLPVPWWGRVGKVLQFVAGLAVILDLIGPSRLLAVGAYARRQVHHAARRRATWSADLRLQERFLLLLAAGAPVVVIGFTVTLHLAPPPENLFTILLVSFGFPAAMVGAMLAVATAYDRMLAWVLRLLLLPVYGAARLLAFLLDAARPGHVMRWTALGLFVVGSQFDLLAS